MQADPLNRQRNDLRSKRNDRTCKRLVLNRRARTSGANGTTKHASGSSSTTNATTCGASGTRKHANGSSSTAAQESLEQTERQNMQAARPPPPRKDLWSKRNGLRCERITLNSRRNDPRIERLQRVALRLCGSPPGGIYFGLVNGPGGPAEPLPSPPGPRQPSRLFP